jgi:hypothetical protein
MITRDEFEDLMNETHAAVNVGKLAYGAGTVLRAIDPVQFDHDFSVYLQYLEEEVNAEE